MGQNNIPVSTPPDAQAYQEAKARGDIGKNVDYNRYHEAQQNGTPLPSAAQDQTVYQYNLNDGINFTTAPVSQQQAQQQPNYTVNQTRPINEIRAEIESQRQQQLRKEQAKDRLRTLVNQSNPTQKVEYGSRTTRNGYEVDVEKQKEAQRLNNAIYNAPSSKLSDAPIIEYSTPVDKNLFLTQQKNEQAKAVPTVLKYGIQIKNQIENSGTLSKQLEQANTQALKHVIESNKIVAEHGVIGAVNLGSFVVEKITHPVKTITDTGKFVYLESPIGMITMPAASLQQNLNIGKAVLSLPAQFVNNPPAFIGEFVSQMVILGVIGKVAQVAIRTVPEIASGFKGSVTSGELNIIKESNQKIGNVYVQTKEIPQSDVLQISAQVKKQTAQVAVQELEYKGLGQTKDLVYIQEKVVKTNGFVEASGKIKLDEPMTFKTSGSFTTQEAEQSILVESKNVVQNFKNEGYKNIDEFYDKNAMFTQAELKKNLITELGEDFTKPKTVYEYLDKPAGTDLIAYGNTRSKVFDLEPVIIKEKMKKLSPTVTNVNGNIVELESGDVISSITVEKAKSNIIGTKSIRIKPKIKEEFKTNSFVMQDENLIRTDLVLKNNVAPVDIEMIPKSLGKKMQVKIKPTGTIRNIDAAVKKDFVLGESQFNEGTLTAIVPEMRGETKITNFIPDVKAQVTAESINAKGQGMGSILQETERFTIESNKGKSTVQSFDIIAETNFNAKPQPLIQKLEIVDIINKPKRTPKLNLGREEIRVAKYEKFMNKQNQITAPWEQQPKPFESIPTEPVTGSKTFNQENIKLANEQSKILDAEQAQANYKKSLLSNKNERAKFRKRVKSNDDFYNGKQKTVVRQKRESLPNRFNAITAKVATVNPSVAFDFEKIPSTTKPPSISTVPNIKNKLVIIPSAISRFETKQSNDSKYKVITQPRINIKTSSVQSDASKVEERYKIVQVVNNQTVQKQIVTQIPSVRQDIKTNVVVVPAQVTKITPQIKPIETHQQIIIKPIVPTFDMPTYIYTPLTPTIKRAKGYRVKVRKFGDVVALNNGKSYDLASAQALANDNIRQTAQASYKIEATASNNVASYHGKEPVRMNDFYKNKGWTIQKANTRISSKGELREITYKGIQANRMGRKWNA